jgi:tRNA(Arg) A34 adenosine deaminase TadA
VHAEQNAILTLAQSGGGLKNAECWVTKEPCLDCTKLLIQAGVSRVVYWRPYPLRLAESRELRTNMRDYAIEAGIQFEKWQPCTDVLDLEKRYEATRGRLAEYVAKLGRRVRAKIDKARTRERYHRSPKTSGGTELAPWRAWARVAEGVCPVGLGCHGRS